MSGRHGAREHFFFANAAGNPDNLLVPDTAWAFFSRHSL
jgi:hypothetical protein